MVQRTGHVLWVLVTLALALNLCCSSATIDTSNLEPTYQCNYMKEVCAEAREFEKSYDKLSEEDQEEMETVLHTYRNQCSDAVKACKKSQSGGQK